KEYFQYDPSGDYLKPKSLQGMRLEKGNYVAIPYEMRPAASSTSPNGLLSLHSEVLGLDLRLYPDKKFRFFDPKSNQILRSYAEAEQDRLQAEAIATQERAIALQERQEKLQERQEKLQERQEKERLAAYLRSIGINPDEIP
ncbi:MAG: Uma2 family endonuclease, partial [Pseudanabaena sp. RU_4_16]|nr:Uma2 family endonuclease [Pseudanabaena sp. RU_4_16]